MKLGQKALRAMGEDTCPQHGVPSGECAGPHPVPEPQGECPTQRTENTHGPICKRHSQEAARGR
jgi:hypothetical protein